MSKSAPALVFDRLFSYTISLVILAETLLIFSISMTLTVTVTAYGLRGW